MFIIISIGAATWLTILGAGVVVLTLVLGTARIIIHLLTNSGLTQKSAFVITTITFFLCGFLIYTQTQFVDAIVWLLRGGE